MDLKNDEINVLKKKEYHKAYYIKNKAYLLDYQQRRYSKKRENELYISNRNEYKKQYYRDNIDKIKLDNKAYYKLAVNKYNANIPKKHIIKNEPTINVIFN
tara:strand:+ start:2523 stop:2825 length:303 start_codon:yes stop_codon:yes gene_type:complete